MTPADLAAWMDRRGLKRPQAAEMLGVTPQAVGYWLRGERGIPTTVERLIACLDASERSDG